MFVIIKHIPSHVTIQDLENFILPVVNGRFYQQQGSIQALKIFALLDRGGLTVERHGLVKVCSDSIKQRLIKSLHGRYLGNERVTVAEYVLRQWHNDRRADRLTAATTTKNRRAADRRRSGLRKVMVCEKTDFAAAQPSFLPSAINLLRVKVV